MDQKPSAIEESVFFAICFADRAFLTAERIKAGIKTGSVRTEAIPVLFPF
jgi:hypothetical protein